MSDEMQSINMVALSTRLYERIAAKGFPNGTALICGKCGNSRLLSVPETAQCLMKGWPKCCARQMQIDRMPE